MPTKSRFRAAPATRGSLAAVVALTVLGVIVLGGGRALASHVDCGDTTMFPHPASERPPRADRGNVVADDDRDRRERVGALGVGDEFDQFGNGVPTVCGRVRAHAAPYAMLARVERWRDVAFAVGSSIGYSLISNLSNTTAEWSCA